MCKRNLILLVLLAAVSVSWCDAAQVQRPHSPRQVPPRRSTQLVDGFGMNVSLPRDPALPWGRRWWTRMFDSGVKWLRIGQYENSSERTSWDWVEQTRGRYTVTEDLDEAIRSLADNGVNIEIQLQYSNPLYEGDPSTRPEHVILPPPGISPGDKPPNPIFIPPTTDEHMDAFIKYVRFMVDRYKGVVKHWELWNEPNIGYWQPDAHNKEQLVEKARAYGRLLARFADAVHEEDPEAKVLSGGTASPDLLFVRTALADAAPKVDIVAYHTYPGFGTNHMPEEMDTTNHAAHFREQIMHVPGVRNNLEFWDNEWNVSPLWKNSNESVQARYVPRFYLYSLAQHVRGFMWTFIPGTDGNEDDLYGIVQGETHKPDAFRPRESYRAFSAVSALFGQTTLDPRADFSVEGVPARYQHGQVQAHAFRDKRTHKLIYAVWLAVLSEPADKFAPIPVDLKVREDDLPNPVLVDVRTGAVSPLHWKSKGVLNIPLKDSVVAVADASYLDWPALPEAPAELRASRQGGEVKLEWKTYGSITGVEVERSVGFGAWEKLATLKPGTTQYSDNEVPSGHVTYRVRVASENGPSAWSNPAWVDSQVATASK